MSRSRSGAYRKSFFCSQQMRSIATDLWPRFQDGRKLYDQGAWSPAELTADVLLRIWKSARPQAWSNGPRSFTDESEISRQSPLSDVQTRRLRGIPLSAQDLLLKWHWDQVELELFFDIPSPAQVLEAQSLGQRCVSLLIESPERFIQGGEDRDSFSFALHDLIHASHFFRDPLHMDRQIFFSRWMRSFVAEPLTRKHLLEDPDFARGLEYLFADMNSHWVHSVKCLKSLFRGRDELTEICFSSLESLNTSTRDLRDLWGEINSPCENTHTHRRLNHALETALTKNHAFPN